MIIFIAPVSLCTGPQMLKRATMPSIAESTGARAICQVEISSKAREFRIPPVNITRTASDDTVHRQD